MSDAVAKLVALRCTACDTALSGHAGDVVFLCPSCPTAVELTRDALVAHPAVFATGTGTYRLWWRFEADVDITRFSASMSAATRLGTISGAGVLHDVVFLVPANEASPSACYRAALEVPSVATTATRQAHAKTTNGRLSQTAAALVARHVFLSLVAKAEGKVHFMDFEIVVKAASVLARPTASPTTD